MKENTFYFGKSVRHWLQFFGTEVFRDQVDPDIWLFALLSAVAGYDERVFIVTDVRFQNEVDVFRDSPEFDTLHIRVHRPSLEDSGDAHRSETSLDDVEPDATIVNDGTLSDLATKAWVLLVSDRVGSLSSGETIAAQMRNK